MAFGALEVKICGMRDPELARYAVGRGVDYIGMIHHANSPRHISLEEMEKLCTELPMAGKVGVVVQPSAELCGEIWNAGVDVMQVHLKYWDESYMEKLTAILPGGKKLWLAPHIAPGEVFPEQLLEYTNCFVVDTYSKDQIGGTGKTGDWTGFRELKNRFPEKTFILAGGLTAENILEAIAWSHANFVDLSSGVEAAPGVKTIEKLSALCEVLDSLNHG